MALKFGFWSEQETQVGQSYARRLHELVDEVRLAEKMGFDCVALSEQHVALGADRSGRLKAISMNIWHVYLLMMHAAVRY